MRLIPQRGQLEDQFNPLGRGSQYATFRSVVRSPDCLTRASPAVAANLWWWPTGGQHILQYRNHGASNQRNLFSYQACVASTLILPSFAKIKSMPSMMAVAASVLLCAPMCMHHCKAKLAPAMSHSATFALFSDHLRRSREFPLPRAHSIT